MPVFTPTLVSEVDEGLVALHHDGLLERHRCDRRGHTLHEIDDSCAWIDHDEAADWVMKLCTEDLEVHGPEHDLNREQFKKWMTLRDAARSRRRSYRDIHTGLPPDRKMADTNKPFNENLR
jgi:hypothetical protein